MQLSRHISNNDGLLLPGYDKRGMDHHLHGRHTPVCEHPGRTQKNDQTSLTASQRTRPLPQTRKMQVRTGRNRFLGHDHITEQCKDGSYQTSRNKRLASPNCSKASPFIPRILQLLSKIHQSLLRKSTTTHEPDKEDCSLRVDSRVSMSLRYSKTSLRTRASLVTSRPRQTVS